MFFSLRSPRSLRWNTIVNNQSKIVNRLNLRPFLTSDIRLLTSVPSWHLTSIFHPNHPVILREANHPTRRDSSNHPSRLLTSVSSLFPLSWFLFSIFFYMILPKTAPSPSATHAKLFTYLWTSRKRLHAKLFTYLWTSRKCLSKLLQCFQSLF